MSLFSILFHFLSILLGEWLQKLAHNISQWQPFLHKVHNYHLSREGNHIFFTFLSFSVPYAAKVFFHILHAFFYSLLFAFRTVYICVILSCSFSVSLSSMFSIL